MISTTMFKVSLLACAFTDGAPYFLKFMCGQSYIVVHDRARDHNIVDMGKLDAVIDSKKRAETPNV